MTQEDNNFGDYLKKILKSNSKGLSYNYKVNHRTGSCCGWSCANMLKSTFISMYSRTASMTFKNVSYYICSTLCIGITIIYGLKVTYMCRSLKLCTMHKCKSDSNLHNDSTYTHMAGLSLLNHSQPIVSYLAGPALLIAMLPKHSSIVSKWSRLSEIIANQSGQVCPSGATSLRSTRPSLIPHLCLYLPPISTPSLSLHGANTMTYCVFQLNSP